MSAPGADMPEICAGPSQLIPEDIVPEVHAGPSQPGPRAAVPEDRVEIVAVAHPQAGGAGPSQMPANGQKRKASGLGTPRDDVMPPPQRQVRRERSQTIARRPAVIIVLDDDDDDETKNNANAMVRFEHGPRVHHKMRKSDVLRFVQQNGREIFLRQAGIVLDNGDEHRLKELAVLITNGNKAEILSSYKKLWAKQLKKCVKAVQAEVDKLEGMAAGLDWEAQENLFTHHILSPKKRQLQLAIDDAGKMESLINFLRDN